MGLVVPVTRKAAPSARPVIGMEMESGKLSQRVVKMMLLPVWGVIRVIWSDIDISPALRRPASSMLAVVRG
jgi:hypothetical protein